MTLHSNASSGHTVFRHRDCSFADLTGLPDSELSIGSIVELTDGSQRQCTSVSPRTWAVLLRGDLASGRAVRGRANLRDWLSGQPLDTSHDAYEAIDQACEDCASDGVALELPSKEGSSRAVIGLTQGLTIADKLTIVAEGEPGRVANFYPEIRLLSGSAYQEHAVKIAGGCVTIPHGLYIEGNRLCRDTLVIENGAYSRFTDVGAGGALRNAWWISAPGDANCDSIVIDRCGGKLAGRGYFLAGSESTPHAWPGALWQAAVPLIDLHTVVTATVGAADGAGHNFVQFSGANFSPTTTQYGDTGTILANGGDVCIFYVDGGETMILRHLASAAPETSNTWSVNAMSAYAGQTLPCVICAGSALMIGPANDANLLDIRGGAFRLSGGCGVSIQGFYGSTFSAPVQATETLGPSIITGFRSNQARGLGGNVFLAPYCGDGLGLLGEMPWLYDVYGWNVSVRGLLYSSHQALLAEGSAENPCGSGCFVASKGYNLKLYSNVSDP